MAHEPTFKLPLSIVSPGDLKKLKREVDEVADTLLQMELREGGEEQAKLPKTSRHLNDVIDDNNINLLHKEERDNLSNLLTQLVDKAPVLHMSFSAEPSPKFLDRLMSYLRDSIDPYAVITVGLAPSIGAGCIIRTNNRYFDLSLKQTLNDHRDDLIRQMAAAGNKSPVQGAAQ